MYLVEALECTHLITVVQDTYNLVITTHQNAHVLQQLIHLRFAQSNAR